MASVEDPVQGVEEQVCFRFNGSGRHLDQLPRDELKYVGIKFAAGVTHAEKDTGTPCID
jgi:hypothetical protein